MQDKQFKSLVMLMTLLNRYYSLLRANRTAIPEVAVLCEVIEELLAPRFVWVQGIYRWPNKEPVVAAGGTKGLSQAGLNHHWLVLSDNGNIIVDVVPALGLKGFETPVVLEQKNDSDARAFIGYFPYSVKGPPNELTVGLQTVRLQMDELLKRITSSKAR